MVTSSIIWRCGKSSQKILVSGLAMHHIYCEHKKSFIVDRAAELGLGGVVLYGKPGRVVVEGTPENVLRYERDIRCLRWQKLQVMGRHEDAKSPHRRRFSAQELLECTSEADLFQTLERHGLDQIMEMIKRPFGAPRAL